MDKYNIRLPNGMTIERELEKEEVEYWISIAMGVSHVLQMLALAFAAEKMDEEANVPVPEVDDEAGLN